MRALPFFMLRPILLAKGTVLDRSEPDPDHERDVRCRVTAAATDKIDEESPTNPSHPAHQDSTLNLKEIVRS
jgi:hypothetical protein